MKGLKEGRAKGQREKETDRHREGETDRYRQICIYMERESRTVDFKKLFKDLAFKTQTHTRYASREKIRQR